MNYNFINGLLGTIILHLLAGIIFFFSKITAIYNQNIQVKVETPETIKEEQAAKELEEQKKALLEKMADQFIESQRRSNTGVNTSGKEAATMDKDLQQTQQELEAAKQQIAGIQENLEKQDDLIKSATEEGEKVSAPKKTEKIQGKLAVYKGPTNIYFDLANRTQVSLYVPVYKCQGNGRVVVNISVNQAGEVESADVDKSKSDNDDCLFEAAQNAAMRSKFNSDFTKAPAKQKGSITYLFVAQ
jgi:TonB family protein